MGKYTVRDSKMIDQAVEEHLQVAVTRIGEHFPNPTILLGGSFGRGEGTVIRNEAGLEILSDYELYIVSGKLWKRPLLDNLSVELTESLGVEVSISLMRAGRLRHNRPKNLAFFSSVPSIVLYELKAGGQILCGRDCLSANPILPHDIPLWEGIRLLYNRMAEAMQRLPASLWLRPDEAELSPEQAMWVNKLVLACVDSLLLLIGQYHYSYQERGKRFQEQWSSVASLLEPDQDWYQRAAKEATAFKLAPTDTKPSYLNVPGFWDNLLDVIDSVFRRLLLQDLGITFESYADLQEPYLSHPKVSAEYSYFRLQALPLPLYHNLIYCLKIARSTKRIPKILLRRPSALIDQWIYVTIPLLFFGVRFRTIEEEALVQAQRTLGEVLQLDNSHSEKACEWAYLCEETARLWSAIW